VPDLLLLERASLLLSARRRTIVGQAWPLTLEMHGLQEAEIEAVQRFHPAREKINERRNKMTATKKIG